MPSGTYSERKTQVLDAVREELDAARRDQIIEAFANVVADKGYPATTVADIARVGHVSKSTVYAHFADKETIYLALHDAVARRIQSILVELERDVTTTTSWSEPARRAIATYLDAIVSEPAFLTQLMVEANNATPAMAKARWEAGERFAATMVRIADRFRTSSDGEAGMTLPMARAFLAAFLGLLQWAAVDGPDAVRQLQAPIEELLHRLVGAPPPLSR
ncbi:MAG: TetR/AcrR family transcriptional regulator [Actinomycetota bacterium]|nr:TetR/AcrR family transcriptional regulator [Actinomycetota bacterium]